MDMYHHHHQAGSPDQCSFRNVIDQQQQQQPTTTQQNLFPSHPHYSSDPDPHPHDFFTHFPSLHSDEAAELEWLSQFVDDTASFHDDDFPPHTAAFTTDHIHDNTSKKHKSSSSGKSRSKREWSGGGGGTVRRCSHCASEKTPQWRTGPLGPKTLCNACGVRFKSGRLVPEYRPAASPTFVLTQHSNSHRKVMELRRQKELLQRQQQQPHDDFKVC